MTAIDRALQKQAVQTLKAQPLQIWAIFLCSLSAKGIPIVQLNAK